jgi:hypothetical protein
MTGLYRSRRAAKPYVDIRDYNALGDNSTDDTAAVTQALAEMTAGLTLLLRPGARYRVAPDTLTFPSLDRLHSDPTYGMGNFPAMTTIGARASFLPTGTGTYLFASAGYVSNAAGGDAGWFISNVEFDGDNTVAIPVIWRAYQGVIDNCSFTRGTTSAFLYTRASADGTVASTYLSDNQFVGNIFRGADTTPSTGPIFATGPTSGSGTAGYGPADTVFVRNKITAVSADIGMHLRSTSHWLMEGNWFAGCAVADLKVKNLSPMFSCMDNVMEIGVTFEDVDGDGTNTTHTIAGNIFSAQADENEKRYHVPYHKSRPALSIMGLPSQSGFLLDLVNSSATNIGGFDGSGRLVMGSSTGPVVTTYAGSPESNVTAPIGSLCTDSTNGVAYVKKSGTGNTGWKLVTQAA